MSKPTAEEGREDQHATTCTIQVGGKHSIELGLSEMADHSALIDYPVRKCVEFLYNLHLSDLTDRAPHLMKLAAVGGHPDQAVALFRGRSSTHEDADPGAVAEVVELCGYLPLVFKVSAAQLGVQLTALFRLCAPVYGLWAPCEPSPRRRRRRCDGT
ncbi:MAG: hypothetical protein ACRDTE_10095 [Pseudonocardiaceae bacterium]